MKRLLVALAAGALLGACSVGRPPTEVPVDLPERWMAPPLAHQGSTQALGDWWARFDDPVLSDWIARAQRHSPDIASARAQVFAARAALAGAEAQGRPQANAVAIASRGRTDVNTPLGTTLSAGVQASWAVGLWDEGQGRVDSAQAQQDAAGARWHEARVLVASEVAQLYFGQRLCREQLTVALNDRDSRRVTADSNEVTERAGLTAPAVAALARASAAEGVARWRSQDALCERQVKSIAAITAQPEADVRAQLGGAPDLKAWLASGRVERLLGVNAVPAEVLRQRPDVYRAQRELVAASEDVGVARAALRPGLTLQGSVLRNHFSGGGLDFAANSWSIGPITLSLPLLGRGALHASADSAQARYEAAAMAYARTLRQAVAEVEQSLVTLSGLSERLAATETAVAGYSRSFEATEARYRVGFANLNELEEARRLKLSADSSAVALQQERMDAWLQLYVALGGGFDPAAIPATYTGDALNPNASNDVR
ncbi:efflux transporter outer membrane subunit [Hydrogenophaga sp. YM1]|uniref:efflux transporter outer membrane subunit n=1 Tax=Hydrogenophaga sp. YM1 TaxID=2806262 RepID=UPI00195ABF32|nr:efflux transporter outer membrane subunit [Hydrogenophaga sp. YM1]QRR32573.1 efflux transporter outer membrane subunit [Hydrogenophaga sp. YM1]